MSAKRMGKSVAVVGGSYREHCDEPTVNRLGGSGLRAVQVLAGLGQPARLVTCMDEELRAEFDAVCASIQDVTVDALPRGGPIGFHYTTPVHPAQRCGTASAEPLTASADLVVAFGMVEDTQWKVNAEWVVVDPQHASLRRLLDHVTTRHLALVLNEHEARNQTNTDDLRTATQGLLAMGAEVVVIKQGARGGIVATAGGTSAFGACPTARVDAIGSGDAFTAGFANAWVIAGEAPNGAVASASRLASAHSLTGAAAFNLEALANVPEALPYVDGPGPQVYLAGPFFSLAERQLVAQARAALIQVGVQVFSPLDDVGPGSDEVAKKDLEGIRGSRSVLALLDGSDPGTLFEVGWATANGVPTVGLAEDPQDHSWTMMRGTGSVVVSDLTTAVYRAAWAALQNVGSS